MKTYRVLSVVAPAGALIAAGEKTLEIRHWAPEVLPLLDLAIVENRIRLSRDGLDEDPAGRVVAFVDVLRVRPWTADDLAASQATTWKPGWLAWELTNVRAVNFEKPYPARRRLYSLVLPSE